MRAKFKLDKLELHPDGASDGVYTIVMTPVIGHGDPNSENSKFFKYTPWGELRMGTVNKSAVHGMVVGNEYYIDITPAP